MSSPILQVKNVTKRFSGVRALTDVDMELYPGEVLAVLGENGAGKSTLVMHEGRISGELQRSELSEEAIMHLATGGDSIVDGSPSSS